MVSFNDIPINILTPGQFIEFDNSRAVQGIVAMPHVALMIGQRIAAGTVAAGVPTDIPAEDSGDVFFGLGSQLAIMCKAFKRANPATELVGIALDDDGGGTAGTQTITFSGTATADGVIPLYIAGKRIEVVVASGDAAAAVSTAADAAIVASADYLRLPITSGEAASVTTLTQKNDGVVGNSMDVRVNYLQGEFAVPGITVVIAAGVTGATDPALSAAITAMADTQYHTIAMPYTDATSLAAMEAELLTRWGPMEQKEGQVFVAALGTQSTLTTLGNTRNSQFLSIVSGGGGGGNSPTTVYEIAAIAAAMDSAEPDPARPRQTLVMKGMLPPEKDHRFTRTERNTLLTDGIATNVVDGGGLVRIERMVTTYQTNPSSVPDPSYKDITTMRTLARLRFDVRTRIALKYPRHKLVDDGTVVDPGQAVVSPSVIRAEIIALFHIWEGQALVEGFVQFIDDLIVERNATDVNRVDMRMGPDLANQFRVMAGSVQFLL